VDGTVLSSDVKNIDKIRSEVGMCFQHFNLFPHLTILENCTLAPILGPKDPKKRKPRKSQCISSKRLKFLIRQTNTPVSCPAANSSGSPLHVACAWRPRIMLFDEPTSALDPEMLRKCSIRWSKLAERRYDHAVRDARNGFRATGSLIGSSLWMRAKSLSKMNLKRFFNNPQSPRTKLFLSQILGH